MTTLSIILYLCGWWFAYLTVVDHYTPLNLRALFWITLWPLAPIAGLFLRVKDQYIEWRGNR